MKQAESRFGHLGLNKEYSGQLEAILEGMNEACAGMRDEIEFLLSEENGEMQRNSGIFGEFGTLDTLDQPESLCAHVKTNEAGKGYIKIARASSKERNPEGGAKTTSLKVLFNKNGEPKLIFRDDERFLAEDSDDGHKISSGIDPISEEMREALQKFLGYLQSFRGRMEKVGQEEIAAAQ